MSQEETKGGETGDKQDAAPEVGQMKKGDYMIHVFIEKARQIKVPEGGVIDPIVQLECMNEKKFTTAKDDIGSTGVPIWNEHIFFEPKNVTVDQIEAAKISIKLNDKKTFKQALVGMYEFDVAYIYFMNKHLLLHKWIALSDPNSENFNEVTAYLKLSISVSCTGDEQVQITDDTGPDDDKVMMPTSIKPEYFQVAFRFYKGEKLPIMDQSLFGKGGSIDAYVLCQYMTQKLKTKVVKMKNEEVYWNQEFLLPVQMPIMTSRLVMKLFDADTVSDEVAGSMIFNLKDYIDQKGGQPSSHFFWKNIYGSPLGVSGKNTKLMNDNPDMASHWKGRILMQVVAEKTEKPILKLQDFPDEIKELATPYFQPHEFEVIAEVGQGIALPDVKNYTVKIRVADYEMRTEKPQYSENTYNRWNQRFQKSIYLAPYQCVEDIGRVYFYLMDGEKPVCFAKDDIRNWMDPNPKTRWFELIPDLSIGKVKDAHKAGLISVKMSINDKTLNGPIDFAQFPAWRKPPPKRPINFKIRCYIFQCRDLPAADSDGQSDPYIVFWDTGKEVKKTKVIEDNVNPLFYETIELSYEANSEEDLPPFVLDVYDKDFNPLDSDDFICRSIIYRRDEKEPEKSAVISDDDTVLRPKWHECRLKQGSSVSGEVLISFSVVADDYNFKTPLAYMNIMDTVDFDENQVEISILGLRGLQSVGILPVKKAFIQFQLKSLVPPNCAQAIENIKTQPGPAGPDPTINTVLKFSIPLPTDPLYCPRLQCSVFDNIFKTFMQPLLGVFTIPVGELMFSQMDQKNSEIKQLRYIVEELDKILDGLGVVSYNIQETPLAVDEPEFRKSITSQKEVIQQEIQKQKTPTPSVSYKSENKSVQKSVNKSIREEAREVKADLFAPLLNNLSDNDSDEDSYGSKKSKSVASTPKKSVSIAGSKTFQQETKRGGKDDDVKSNKSYKSNKSGKSNKSYISNTKRQRTPSILEYAEKERSRRQSMKSNQEKVVAEIRESEAKSMRELETVRESEIEELKRKGENPYKTIVKPKYELDELLQVYREIDPPPDALYIGLGYDDVPEDNRRHYRKFYPKEMELIEELMPKPSPFIAYLLKRGQSRGASKGMFSFSTGKEDDGEQSTEQVVGKFKCLIDVYGEKFLAEYNTNKEQLLHDLKTKLNQLSMKNRRRPLEYQIEKLQTLEGKLKFQLQLEKLGVGHLNIPKFLVDLHATATLKRLLLGQNKTMVRLYMVSAFNLSSRDADSPSDPYLVVSLGSKVYNERENHEDDNANPGFYKFYDFEATFPGCPMLNIACFDYDDLFGDDLIGETKIDLEDRFFSPEWQSIRDKPIEYRGLYIPSSSISQGTVKCWLEIMPGNIPPDQIETWQIAPRPPEIFEVRVCIFDTLDIKMMDAEGCSDVFIRAFFDSKEEDKETDTHFRCQDGKASFNYRFIFRVPIPRTDYSLNVQAYDRDLFSSNDIIGEGKIDLRQAFEDVQLTKKPIQIAKDYVGKCLSKKGVKLDFKDDSSFWMQMETVNDKGKLEKTGKVRIQIDILPLSYAEQNKVGEARQEPNMNPFLPPPVGRLSLSLNPLKMFVSLMIFFQHFSNKWLVLLQEERSIATVVWHFVLVFALCVHQ